MNTTVDGVEIAYDSCAHCGKSPSPDDIRKAIADERGMRHPCGVCGDPFLIRRVEIYHYKEKGIKERWGTRASWMEPMVDIDFSHGLTRSVVHLRCAKKAFPNVNWIEVEGSKGRDEGLRHQKST